MEDLMLKDRRAGDRVPFAFQVMIVFDEQAWVADVLDLSEGGCGVFRPEACALREGNVAQLYFFERAGAAVHVSARLARVTQRHLGFEYHDLQTIPPSQH